MSSPVGPVAPSTESHYVSGPRHERSVAVNHLGLITLLTERKDQRPYGQPGVSAKVAAAASRQSMLQA